MPRSVSIQEKLEAIKLIREGVSQRDIHAITGLSRPYIRKIGRELGHTFPRNGYEIRGTVCVCANCGTVFRRPPSKIERAETHYCSTSCKSMHMRGRNNPNWKGGTSVETFSEWIKRQADYKDWAQKVLERDGYTCQITGLKEDLEAHHIKPKGEKEYEHLALDVNNGITVSKPAHTYIHQLISAGEDYEVAVEKAKEHFKKD